MVGTLGGIIGCVSAGIGVTLFPRSVVGPAWRKGAVAIHELPAGEARVDTVFTRRRGAFVPSALSAFLCCARAGPGSRRRTPTPRGPRARPDGCRTSLA